MKKISLSLIAIFLITQLFAQKTEWRIGLNTGFFSFYGKSTQPTTFLIYDAPTNTGYTNNPYGSKNGIGYGVTTRLNRVTKNNLVFGLDLGYEWLKSKTAIDQISVSNDTTTVQYVANGATYLHFNFLNFQPFFGYRFDTKFIKIDLTGGLELADCLQAKENGKALAANGKTYQTNLERETIKMDIRPNLRVAIGYKEFGIYAGYSLGQVNYKSNYIGGTHESYARLLRLGMTYQLH